MNTKQDEKGKKVNTCSYLKFPLKYLLFLDPSRGCRKALKVKEL